jgi:cytochrome c biogenesis protein
MGLAAVSIVGTLIPQNAAPEVYAEKYGETVARLFLFLKIDDMYHSWWFYFLLSLLTVNIIACSLRRVRKDWRMITSPLTVLDDDLEGTLPCARAWTATGGVKDLESVASDLLRKEFSAPRVTTTGDEIHIFARKQPLALFGVYALHAGIVVILTGVVIGSLFGFSKAFVEVEEKGAAATAYSRSGEPIELGFTVRCEGFSVSYYDTGTPKEYRSVLSIIDGGKTVVDRRPVVVNDPLTYRGITFYQSGYSAAAFLFSARDRKTGISSRVNARAGEKTSLPNGDQLVVMDSLDEIRGHSPRFSGPAVHVAVLPSEGSPESFVLMKNHPDVNADRGGAYQLCYGGVSAWNTVLQVTRDPGVPVVWGGCVFLLFGFGMTFFMSHRRIWIRIGKGRIVMAGGSSRNQASFRMFFDDLAEKLNKAFPVSDTTRKP